MEPEPSTHTLSTLFPPRAICHAIRPRFDFGPSQKSCFWASGAVSLQNVNHVAIRISFQPLINLFWTISETLYPSRLISFSINPSLCPTSPKRWVLGQIETFETEVNLEQRSETQRHRGAVGQRGHTSQKATVGCQSNRVAHAGWQGVSRRPAFAGREHASE